VKTGTQLTPFGMTSSALHQLLVVFILGVCWNESFPVFSLLLVSSGNQSCSLVLQNTALGQKRAFAESDFPDFFPVRRVFVPGEWFARDSAHRHRVWKCILSAATFLGTCDLPAKPPVPKGKRNCRESRAIENLIGQQVLL
jgi:hypothetical protein